MKAPISGKVFDRELLQLAQGQRELFALTISFHAAVSASIVAQAYLLSKIIAAVFLEGANLAVVQQDLSYLLLIILLRAAFTGLGSYTALETAIRIKESLRTQLFHHVQQLGPTFAQGERTGELINTFTEGIEALDAYFSQYVPQLVLALLSPLIVLLAVFNSDLLSAVILVLTAPLIPIFMVLVGQGSRRLTERQWQGLSHMSAHFFDVLQGLATLKILGQNRTQVTHVAQISHEFGRATMRILRVTFLSSLVLELVATLSVAIIAVQIGLRLLEGALSFQVGLFVLVLAPEFYAPLRLLGSRFHAGMEGTAAAARIFNLLRIVPMGTPGKATAAPQELGTIAFENVSFAYDNGERPALTNVSLRIEPGSHVAVVGPSGAGKSTLVQLLLGLIRPTQGTLRIGQCGLEEINRDEWLKNVAWAPQLPYLTNNTIAANIQMGREQADLAEIMDAARHAQAHAFIMELADGYATLVGEHGVRLSGGQAQRIALARAFLKRAPLLILDEPTAHLDAESEAKVVQAIARLSERCTVITITHRLNTIEHADHVVQLRDGRVVAEDIRYRRRKRVAGQNVGASTRLYANGQNGHERAPASAPVAVGGMAEGGPSPKEKESATITVLRKLMSELRAQKAWIVASVLLGALTVGSSIGLLGTSATLISMAALQPSIADLGVSIVGVRFFGITRGLARYLERLTTHTVTFRLLAQLRARAFALLEPHIPARSATVGSGDLLARVVSDVTTLEDFYVRAVAPPFVAVLICIASSLLLLWFHWHLALVLIIFCLLGGVVLPAFVLVCSRTLSSNAIGVRTELKQALVDALQGAADITVFGQLPNVRRQITTLGSRLAEAQRRFARLSGAQDGLSTLLSEGAAWALLLAAILLIGRGQLPAVYLAGMVMIGLATFEAISPIPSAVLYLEDGVQAARRLFELENWSLPVPEPERPRSLPSSTSANLALRAIHLRYNREDAPALSHVSVDIPQGKRLAIVGSSGAGKSSLGHLLLRFWQPDSGQILLDGQDINAYGCDDVRSLMNVINQKAYLFNASIADNIRLARPGAKMEEIVEAATNARLHAFITTLPHGYKTIIGERGMGLSGGQRQRVALARAFIRPAPVMLLDEPTASLDKELELEILSAAYAGAKGQTIIYIGHRLVLMDTFDEIIVLHNGRIVEAGTHQALLDLGGLYSDFWWLQNETGFSPTHRSRIHAVS